MFEVSVIIPNYNHQPYLDQRITSILSQTFRNFEIIILDDCSNDNSRDVIEKYRNHPQVTQIIYNTENSGSTFKQWKKGIELAKGIFIWIAESDDWCEPTLLETLINGLRGNKNAGIAFCQSCYFVEPNTCKSYTYYPFFENYESGNAFISNYMLNGNAIVNASMSIWKKSLFVNIDQAYTNFKFSGDWLFYISIMQQSDVFVSGKVLNYFRNHSTDVSTKSYKSGLNFIEDIRIYEILLERELISEQKFKSLLERAYLIYLFVKTTVAQENQELILKKYQKHLSFGIIHRMKYVLKFRGYRLKNKLFA